MSESVGDWPDPAVADDHFVRVRAAFLNEMVGGVRPQGFAKAMMMEEADIG